MSEKWIGTVQQSGMDKITVTGADTGEFTVEEHSCACLGVCPCHQVEPAEWWFGPSLVLFAFVVIGGCFWVTDVLLDWTEGNQTLVQVIIRQWHWLIALLHRIY